MAKIGIFSGEAKKTCLLFMNRQALNLQKQTITNLFYFGNRQPIPETKMFFVVAINWVRKLKLGKAVFLKAGAGSRLRYTAYGGPLAIHRQDFLVINIPNSI